MSELRKVNLKKNSSSNMMIKTKNQVKSYEEDKRRQIEYINDITNLLKVHNEKIAPIVENYKRRRNQV